MRASTAIKLAIAAVIAILFSGLVLRAAMKLAAIAMHSILGIVIVGHEMLVSMLVLSPAWDERRKSLSSCQRIS